MTIRSALFRNKIFNISYPNPLGYIYYGYFLYKKYLHPGLRTADPFTVIKVDPQSIDSRVKNGHHKWKSIGEVRGGNWHTEPLIQYIKYRGVFKKFNNNVEWENTDLYKRSLNKIANNESYWNGCQTVGEVIKQINHVECLYDDIRINGFKSQKEIHDKSIREILLSPQFDRSKTDIAVSIGPKGEILFIDGNHRLAISKSIKLSVVPVRVVVRHKDWQKIRNEVKCAGSQSELSEVASGWSSDTRIGRRSVTK